MRIYPLLKVFNKRVYLPIIPIFYIHYVGFSIQEFGMLAAMYALTNLVINVPAGYLADRFGRSRSPQCGSFAPMELS